MKYLLWCIFILPSMVLSQKNAQNIRGTVTDKLTQTPLIGATVQINSIQKTAVTDSLGTYIISDVAPNRYDVIVTYDGYKNYTATNVVVTSGKEVILDISLEENFKKLNEVVVGANRKEGTINKFSSVSARSFSMEEVNRFAGGRSDPARLVANFAGVSAPDDSRNDIVIRGNSPIGVLWKIDGMTVTNPNHFASIGTTGGAVSALNTNLLKNSDFFTSAFPAEYGNAVSGVFDIGFRNGNNKKRETTIQAGVITGLEITTEGPFSKKSEASYLIGYRYALAGIAQKLGINIGTSATPSYSDLSFKLNSGKTKWGKFSFFGILANSTIELQRNTSNTLYGNGNEMSFGSKIGIWGLNQTIQINANSFISSNLGINSSSSDQTGYKLDNITQTDFIKESTNVSETRYNISSSYNSKLNSRLFLKVGFIDEIINLSLKNFDRNNANENFNTIWNYKGNSNLAQVFALIKYNMSEKLVLNAGIHSQMYFLNNSYSIEPRLGLIYNINNKSTLNFGYGLHTQMQPMNVYFLQSTNADGTIVYNNKNLDFTKSQQFVLGYNLQPYPNWRLKTEIYYQSIYDVPVNTFSSSFSMLNTGATFKSELADNLINKGTGTNYGMEFTLEKFFSKGYYGLFTTSLYSSKYKGSDGIERNTAFNGKFVYNILAGKEWKMGKEDRNKFALDFKYTNAGGRAFTPINLEASINANHEVRSTNAYSDFYPNYNRMDLKISFVFNSLNKKLSQSVALDLHNITNYKNVFSQKYDDATHKISTNYQLGFFPNFIYSIQF